MPAGVAQWQSGYKALSSSLTPTHKGREIAGSRWLCSVVQKKIISHKDVKGIERLRCLTIHMDIQFISLRNKIFLKFSKGLVIVVVP